MGTSEIDYPAHVQRALRNVLRDVLQSVADDGFPGEHHLYVTFRTDTPGTLLPAPLRRQHPNEMTIVLQNQYWDLVTEDDLFSVTLKFDGAPTRLTVPFEAVTAFVDPAAEFGLRFADGGGIATPDGDASNATDPVEPTPPERDGVVSLAGFKERRKRER